MYTLVMWELRKMVCRWSVLAVLCVVLVFIYNTADSRIPISYGRDSDYQQFYVQYEGKTSEDFAAILQEQTELRRQHPEQYEELYTDPKTGEQYIQQTHLGSIQNQFLYYLTSDQYYSEEYRVTLEEELQKRQREGTTENFGTRLLQKHVEIYANPPPRTITVGGDYNLTPFDGVGGGVYAAAALFFIVFAVAPIYSRERRAQADTLLLTCKKRGCALYAKSIAVAIVSVFTGLILQLIFLAVYSRIYQPNWSASLASLPFFTTRYEFIGLSIGQAYLVVLGLFLLGCLCAGWMTMFFSSLSQSSISALGASALLLIYPLLLNMLNLPSIGDSYSFDLVQAPAERTQQLVAWLKTLSIPGMQATLNMDIWFHHYLNLFGWPVPQLAVAAVFGALVAALTLLTPLWYIRHNTGIGKHKKKGGLRHVQAGGLGAA